MNNVFPQIFRGGGEDFPIQGMGRLLWIRRIIMEIKIEQILIKTWNYKFRFFFFYFPALFFFKFTN